MTKRDRNTACILLVIVAMIALFVHFAIREMAEQTEARRQARLDECNEKGGVLVEQYRSIPLCYPKGTIIPLSK